MRLYIDFETRSPVDLRKSGAWVYSEHKDTDILCWSALTDKGEKITAYPKLMEHALDPDVIFVAHNAFFEQCIWHNVLFKRGRAPALPVERWRCTMAKVLSHALPRSLDQAAKALHLPVQKDEEGYKLMLRLCKPRKKEDTPQEIKRLQEYCDIDVFVEKLIDESVPDLNTNEQKLWFLDQQINLRGIHVDYPLVELFIKYIGLTEKELIQEFKSLTSNYASTPNQQAKVLEWFQAQGLDIQNVQKNTLLKEVLKHDGPIKRAIEIRQEFSKTSRAKYFKFLACRSKDDRVRGTTIYHAATTGRWGGSGVQLQNLPRGNQESEKIIAWAKTENYGAFSDAFSRPMDAYSSAIRGVIVARPGCRLLVGDYSAIEARVTAWISGQQDILDTFSAGGDIYCSEAAKIYGRQINSKDKPERMIGKVAVLALGYMGGIRAFGSMARIYGVDLNPVYDLLWSGTTPKEKESAEFCARMYFESVSEEERNIGILSEKAAWAANIIKDRWRQNNQSIVKFWEDINGAFLASQSGEKIVLRNITTAYNNNFLYCRLPSGRCLAYPEPKIGYSGGKSVLTHMSINSLTKKYERIQTYGGRLTENIVQAVSRDIMAEAMLRLEAAGYPIVLTVHDEIVCEVPVGFGSLSEFIALMEKAPAWASDLPIKVEAWEGSRYKKG